MKLLIAIFVILLSLNGYAQIPTYYPQDFITKVSSGALLDEELKDELHIILTSTHQADLNGGQDSLGCSNSKKGKCYQHVSLGYEGARKILFGQIHLEQIDGKYSIKDVYCRKIFSGKASVGPGAIPRNEDINCEHTWPQSKFSRLFPKDIQKSDLHHLYPTDSKANSVRGNYDFADVKSESGALNNCEASKSGTTLGDSGDDFFEPPTEHKGNVARALFYFSVRYRIQIPANEEKVLRRWNELDPVDAVEMKRNNTILEVQGNRNPFIDMPQLANYINRF